MSTREPHAMFTPKKLNSFKNKKQKGEISNIKRYSQKVETWGNMVSRFCCVSTDCLLIHEENTDLQVTASRKKTTTKKNMLDLHPATRMKNKYIYTIPHCNVPDFKYVRFSGMETTKVT